MRVIARRSSFAIISRVRSSVPPRLVIGGRHFLIAGRGEGAGTARPRARSGAVAEEWDVDEETAYPALALPPVLPPTRNPTVT